MFARKYNVALRSPKTARKPRPTCRSPRSGPASAATGRARRPSATAYGLLIVLAGTLAYASSFDGVFVFDDIPALSANASIRSLHSALQPPLGPTTSGRPVANLSFAINYAFSPAWARDSFTSEHPGGDDAVHRNAYGYHAVNLAIHLMAALTLFGLGRRAFASPAMRGGLTDIATPLAALVAATWVVHPLTTQAVTYIVQRTESLMGLFYLLTLYCAVRAGEGTVVARRWWTGGAVVACALGMGTKEVMLTAPLMVMLWDVVFRGEAPDSGRSRRPRWGLYLGLWATLAVPVSIALASETQGRVALALIVRPEQAAAVGVGGTWTAWTYLLAQAAVILHYLRLAAIPWPLTFDHYGWPTPPSSGDVAAQAVVLFALLLLSLYGLSRRHPAGFAGVWFFITLAPTSSIVPIPTEIAAEHRMYLPLIGVVSVLIGGGAALVRRFSRAAPAGRAVVVSRGAILLAAAIVVILGSLTHVRNRDYSSDARLWQDTVEKRPANARARYNHALNLMKAGRYGEAAAQMETALTLPADRQTAAAIHLQLGAALSAQGHVDRGLPHLERATELDPDIPEADLILGQAYSERGEMARAIRHFRAAAARAPHNPMVLSRTAWLLATASDPADRDPALAMELAARAVTLTNGSNEPALSSLAAAYAAAGRYADSAAALRRGLALARQAGDRETEAVLARRLELIEAAARQ